MNQKGVVQNQSSQTERALPKFVSLKEECTPQDPNQFIEGGSTHKSKTWPSIPFCQTNLAISKLEGRTYFTRSLSI